MAKFEVTTARRELGFTPTRAVRADIDVRTGEGAVGAAIGQGLVQLTGNRSRIEEKRRQMQDANSAVVANKLRDTATIEFETYKLNNPQETWEEFRTKQVGDVATKIGALDFSSDASDTQRLKSEAYTSKETARSLTQATRQLRTDTIATLTEAMTEAFRSGDIERIAESTRSFAGNGDNMGKDKDEVLSDIKAAKEAGLKLRGEDAADTTYAAIEAGQFDAAKEFATNPAIPESRQATLRTAIGTAENKIIAEAKALQIELINKTTSDTIREFYQGGLTVAELDKRHKLGLIKDPNFEKMRKGLAAAIPDISDSMVRSTINNAITQFKANQISREDAQNIFLSSLPFLDKTDRKKFDDAIEKTTTVLVETAMAEAKDAGKELISPKFQKFDPFSFNVFDDPEDERRFNLEWRLRNQYNDALDEWKEAQAGKVITPTDVRRIENDLLINYRKVRSRGLDAIQAEITRTGGRGLAGPPLPLRKAKSLRDIKTDRLKARREELRKQLK